MPEFAGVDVHDLLRIRPATAGVRSLTFTGESWPLCWSGEFFFNDLTDNMVIDNFLVVLRTIDQAMGTELVNQAGGAGGVTEDLTDCRVRENILAGPGIIEMSANVVTGLGAIVMVKAATDVESLPDSGIDLTLEQIPQLALTDQNQGHRTF